MLSEIAVIAENNLRLQFEPGHGPIGDERPIATTFMTLPPEHIAPLKECIQFSDPQSQDRIANLIRHFQVQQSRQRSEPDLGQLKPSRERVEWTADLHKAVNRAIDWAVIYALVGSMFKFARGTQRCIPKHIDYQNVLETFWLSGLTPELYPNLELVLDERGKSGALEKKWERDDS